MMESNENINMLRQCTQQGLVYLVQLSNVPEDELFKICLEFWNWLAYDTMCKHKGN